MYAALKDSRDDFLEDDDEWFADIFFVVVALTDNPDDFLEEDDNGPDDGEIYLNNPHSSAASHDLLYWILGVVLGVLLLILIVFVVMCAIKQKQHRRSKYCSEHTSAFAWEYLTQYGSQPTGSSALRSVVFY